MSSQRQATVDAVAADGLPRLPLEASFRSSPRETAFRLGANTCSVSLPVPNESLSEVCDLLLKVPEQGFGLLEMTAVARVEDPQPPPMPMREAMTILSDRRLSKMVHKAYVGTIAITVRRKWRRGYCKHKDSCQRSPHNASLFQ